MNTVIDGLNINYREEGTGPLLVMLHGWGSNIDLFNGVINFASKKYHVVAMDMPGFGKSDEPSFAYSVDDYIAFVVKFVKSLFPEEKEVIFLGHSHGGRVSIKMAARSKTEDFGFKIKSLILVDSAGVIAVKTPAQLKRQKKYKFYKKLITKSGILKIYPDALNKLQKKFGSADYSAASPIMRASMVKVVNEDMVPYMPDVTMPALLIWGKNDTATPLSDGQKMEKLMPESGLAAIDNAGHYSFLDQPYIFNKILGSFLKIEI